MDLYELAVQEWKALTPHKAKGSYNFESISYGIKQTDVKEAQ